MMMSVSVSKSQLLGCILAIALLSLGPVVRPVLGQTTPTSDLSLQFRVYLFGLPTWFDGTVDVAFDQDYVVMSSEIENVLLSNWHRSELTFSDCNYRPIRYHNEGFSPGWKFDDAIEYDWSDGVARYQGQLQRPSETSPSYQELEYALEPQATHGYYVDKLSQFFVMGCHFADASQEAPLLLNYIDDTLGRYRVSIVERGKKLRVAGKSYRTIQVVSEPFEATPGSIHRRVNYWLVPELGYLPALIKTKLGRIPLTIRLRGVDTAGE
jgi:hypothetical protein